MPGYSGKEEYYPYSSYGIYLGVLKDEYGIVDIDYIISLFGKDSKEARLKYKAFVESMKNNGVMKEVDDNIINAYTENEYLNEKYYVVRERSPDEILSKVGEFFGEKLTGWVRLKYNREVNKIRAFAIYVLRVLCGYTYKELCKYIGNISISGISRLSNEGFNLYKKHEIYQNVFNSLINVT